MLAPARSSGLRVGLPRALLYHRYGPLWTAFLEGLGADVVVSRPTDVALARRGDELAPDEACLPVKLYLGHVASLADEVDAVFAPRIVSVARREENCQKYMGTYDLVANTLPGLRLVTYEVDMRWRQGQRAGMCAMGRELAGRGPVLAAYERARARQRSEERAAARREREALASADVRPKVLLVGHAYVTDDALVGAPIAKLLTAEGLRVVNAEPLGRGRADRAEELSRDLYWTFSRELLAAVAEARGRVDGIVFLSTFPCGPDSLVTEICRLRLDDKPLLALVVDDFHSDVGLRTRIESFADIVKSRVSSGVGVRSR
jgi:predicted nucleotide-binding protein (sugar kinase/HSP70/actin superfamily)